MSAASAPGRDLEREAARQRLLEASRQPHVRKVVDAWPPLTESQRTRLAAILRGNGVDHARA